MPQHFLSYSRNGSLYALSLFLTAKMSYSPRGVPPPPPMRQNTERRTMPAPPPPINNNNIRQGDELNMQSPLNRMSTIPVQPSYHSADIDIPEPPQTEAGRWTFHSQKEFPPPPPFEKKLKRYPTGAETGCCKCTITICIHVQAIHSLLSFSHSHRPFPS